MNRHFWNFRELGSRYGLFGPEPIAPRQSRWPLIVVTLAFIGLILGALLYGLYNASQIERAKYEEGLKYKEADLSDCINANPAQTGFDNIGWCWDKYVAR